MILTFKVEITECLTLLYSENIFCSGFIIYPHKSIFIPTLRLVFLGFILVQMGISLTSEKMANVNKSQFPQSFSMPFKLQ